MTKTTDQLAHEARLARLAAQGEASALRELKALHPRKEFRRKWDDLHGFALHCRGKGSKAKWLRF